jgi:hypothetical protein
MTGASVFLRFFYAGDMRQSIVLKSFIIIAGVIAVGGAVFLGFRHIREVRGDSAVGEPVPHVEGVSEVDTLREEDPGSSLRDLGAGGYATYTHPGYGFSLSYPKEFALLTDSWGNEDVIDLHHPTLPLGMRVSVRPLDLDGELVASLTSLSDEYDMEAPEGAESNAVGWIEEDVPEPGMYRGVYWFAAHDHLFEIQMTAEDPAWLEAWMHALVQTDFTLTRQPSAL